MAIGEEPLDVILGRARSADPAVRHSALEAIAFKVADMIGLCDVSTRLSGQDTGGDEADFIFENHRLVYPRWQVQCRNSDVALVDDVAREVGLLDYFHADVGVVISTGRFDPEAKQFAKAVRRKIRQPLLLIDSDTLYAAAHNHAVLLDAVRKQAPQALAPSR